MRNVSKYKIRFHRLCLFTVACKDRVWDAQVETWQGLLFLFCLRSNALRNCAPPFCLRCLNVSNISGECNLFLKCWLCYGVPMFNGCFAFFHLPKTKQFSSTTIESVSSRESGNSWEVQDSMGQLSLQGSLWGLVSAWWPILRIWTFWGCLCSFLCLAFPITGILKDYSMDIAIAVV